MFIDFQSRDCQIWLKLARRLSVYIISRSEWLGLKKKAPSSGLSAHLPESVLISENILKLSSKQ